MTTAVLSLEKFQTAEYKLSIPLYDIGKLTGPHNRS